MGKQAHVLTDVFAPVDLFEPLEVLRVDLLGLRGEGELVVRDPLLEAADAAALGPPALAGAGDQPRDIRAVSGDLAGRLPASADLIEIRAGTHTLLRSAQEHDAWKSSASSSRS